MYYCLCFSIAPQTFHIPICNIVSIAPFILYNTSSIRLLFTALQCPGNLYYFTLRKSLEMPRHDGKTEPSRISLNVMIK